MNYFDYVKTIDSGKAYAILQCMDELKPYAKAVYNGSLWEDSLDSAFFHILDNFDESLGSEFKHYATKVVGKIGLGKYNKEIEHEISLNNALDQKSVTENKEDPLNYVLLSEMTEVSENERECIKYLVPYFIKDYRFFKSKKAEDRTLVYTGLFEKFSAQTISASMEYFNSNYGTEMDLFQEIKKTCRYRNFNEDRYKSSLDEGISYEGSINNIITYRSKKKLRRYFYYIDLSNYLKHFIDFVYNQEDSEGLKVNIEGETVYCTLAGNTVIGEEELLETLEREIVGSLLSKNPGIKVVVYEKGSNIILSSTKDDEDGLLFEIKGKSLKIEFDKRVAKRIGGL